MSNKLRNALKFFVDNGFKVIRDGNKYNLIRGGKRGDWEEEWMTEREVIVWHRKYATSKTYDRRYNRAYKEIVMQETK